MTEQTICFKCSINPNRGLEEKPKANESCLDCKEGTDIINCLDCDQEMVFCCKFGYYHSTEIRPYGCWWFKPKGGNDDGKI